MTLQEANETYKGRYVKYAGGFYKCVNVIDMMGCLFCEIYDEPPSHHIDRVKLSSVKHIETDEDIENFAMKLLSKN